MIAEHIFINQYLTILQNVRFIRIGIKEEEELWSSCSVQNVTSVFKPARKAEYGLVKMCWATFSLRTSSLTFVF